MDDFETRLSDELHELVDDAHPSPQLRARLGAGLRYRRRRAAVPIRAVAAAVVALALFGVGVAVATTGEDADGSVTVAAQVDDGERTAERDDPRPPATSTTTVAPESPVVTEPQPDPVPDEPEVLSGSVAPTPTTAAPPAEPACRNSTDPACGPFRWDPAPTNRPATLSASVEGPVYAGESFAVALVMSDPDGAVEFDCVLVEHDGPGIEVGSCGPVENTECPDRYGPWTPPAPKGGQGSTSASIMIDEPGTYTVTARVSSYSACANVDPYRSDATSTIDVEVLPAPEASD